MNQKFPPFFLILFLSVSSSLLAQESRTQESRTQESRTQDFLKKLLTKEPGPLSQSHQEYDTLDQCISCHQNRFGGELAHEKCFTCHQDIKIRIEKKVGYHKDKPVCKDCHAEHKGIKHSIFAPKNWLDRFNHDETDYALLGKHQKVNCRNCHTEFRKHTLTQARTNSESYLNASTTCLGCHEKDYKHDFQDKKLQTCTHCHSSLIEEWKMLASKMTFDHQKTAYPLEGLHLKVKCNECHKPDPKAKRVTTFAPLDFAKCTSCHVDPHQGSLGPNCTSCHSVYRKWNDIIQVKKEDQVEKGFDHAKTAFPLLGYHQATQCEQCHFQENSHGLSSPRLNSHGLNSPGLSKNFKVAKFNECSDCHGFQHDIQFSKQTCESCHQVDMHFNETTYTAEQHQKLDFPLTGKHLVMDCNKCHLQGQFEQLPHKECSTCHRNPHDQREIDHECSFCHLTTTFSWIQFDHNENTKFRLTGKHRDVACLSCHVNEVFKNMPASNENPNCQACHEDPHGTAMPDECTSCHRTEGFHFVRNFDHKKIGKWALEGKHTELSCQKCHAKHLLKDYSIPLTQKGMRASDCANCHVDVHEGTYGSQCDSCHSTQSFAVDGGAKVHDTGYFKLEGYHDQLPCGSCHRADTNLQGLGSFCQTCHEKNDVHQGQFGSRCGECHSQTSWRLPRFRHNQTAFPLTGAHRYVSSCSECHVNQIYQGLPNDCYFCHADSHLPATATRPHTPGFPQDCSECHSVISWTIRRGGGIP